MTDQNPDARSGFALVMALALMAFVLLLLVSMMTLVQVETRNASNTLAQLRAKESARLALMMAIGDLQRHAGPDQRVTARAEILGSGLSNENPYWTGVWDSADPSVTPRWMVSWQDQNAAPNTNTLELLGAGSIEADTTQHVDAPIIEISNANTEKEHIAWWTSDEGVKASLGSVPLNLRADPNFLDSNAVDALELQLAANHGFEELIDAYDRYNSLKAESLDRIQSVEKGLELIGKLPSDDLEGESAYHVFSQASYGVLSNTLATSEGGLMKDLSLYPALLGDAVENFLGFGELHANEQTLSVGDVDTLRLFTPIQGLDDIGTLNDGDIANVIAPILSNFMLAFTIRSNSPVSSNPNFYLRMRFFCEFWNPYTHNLQMTDSAGNDLELELEISGLPTVTAIKTTGTLGSSSPIDLQALLGDSSVGTDNPLIIRLTHDYSLDWLPGQAKNWTGVDASTSNGTSPYRSILNDGKDWASTAHNLGGSAGLDTGIPRLSGDIRHESDSNDSISVRVFLRNLTDGTKKLVSELENLTYEPISTRLSGYSSTHSGTTFGYHFVLRGPHLSADSPDYYRGLWLHDHDPRNPSPAFNLDWYLDNDILANTGSAFVPVKDGISPLPLPLPSEINETTDNINTQVFRRIMDRSYGSSDYYDNLWQDTPLFEIPRERVLSLASLQHLYIHNERPFQVGNSWGKDGVINTSEWFDQYYFSGISRNDPTNIEPVLGLPNPILVGIDFDNADDLITEWQSAPANSVTDAREPSAHLMVSNRFNLNSTSIAAWKAILGSLRIKDYTYLDYPENDTSDLSTLTTSNASKDRMFSRFSHSLLETYEATETPFAEGSEPVAPSAYYRHGARRLTETQITDLASEVVDRLKSRGAPFTTMEEFISADATTDQSLLEESIEAVMAPDGRQKWYHDWELDGDQTALASTPIDIDHFSPGFLTQADILTAIGPMLSPRSDTFKIRTRAQSFSALGAITGEAAIEAIIQRIPEPIDSAVDITSSTNRRFRILTLRWLETAEL